MRWLWYVGPVVVFVVFLWSAFWPSRRERWRVEELRRWVRDFLGPLDVAAEKPPVGAKRGKGAAAPPAPTTARLGGRLPQSFEELVEKAGFGSVVGNVVLIPKLAYLAVRKANRLGGSDHQTVVAKLAKAAPSFVLRPVPLVEGRRQEGQGVAFENDAPFNEQFLVEGADAKAIKKWLDAPTREALLELPGVWLRTDGRLMALTTYGDADADKLDELVGTADALFAERGAGGAPSLFGEGADEDEGDELGDESASYREEPLDKRAKRPVGAGALAEGRAARVKALAAKQGADAPLATVGARTMAFVVDAGLYAAAGAVLLGVLAMRDQGLRGLFGIGAGTTDEFDGGWQGGWDTKGFGALVVAESLLLGLFVLQTYWAAHRGQTIGMRLLGARVVRLAGESVEFFRGVALRTWVFGLVPLALALVMTRPIHFRALLANVIDPKVLGALGACIVLDGLVMLVGDGRRALHDYLTGTRVVVAPRDMFDSLKRS